MKFFKKSLFVEELMMQHLNKHADVLTLLTILVLKD